jgi:hypothetical protein
LLFLASTIFLYVKKAAVKVDVIYIPKPLELNKENSGSEKLPEFSLPSTETMINFEEFDYNKLIAHSIEILEKGTEVSTFVVDKENALKIVNKYKSFLINILSENAYFVVLPIKDVKIPGLIPGKSVYTIFLKTGENPEQIFQDMMTLKANAYVSYSMRFKRNNKTFYTLCLGAFPDIDTAKEYFNSLDLEKLRSLVVTYGPYVGKITP